MDRWRKAPLDQNLAAVKKLCSRYSNTVRPMRKTFYSKAISVVSNQQAELFGVICTLTDTGEGRLQSDDYIYDHFAVLSALAVEGGPSQWRLPQFGMTSL